MWFLWVYSDVHYGRSATRVLSLRVPQIDKTNWDASAFWMKKNSPQDVILPRNKKCQMISVDLNKLRSGKWWNGGSTTFSSKHQNDNKVIGVISKCNAIRGKVHNYCIDMACTREGFGEKLCWFRQQFAKSAKSIVIRREKFERKHPNNKYFELERYQPSFITKDSFLIT